MGMRIGVDIDNVTLEFQPYWEELYEEWFGLGTIRKYTGTWDAIVEATHFRSSREFFEWFDQIGGWDDMPWIPGAGGALQHLAVNNSIVFVTSRHTESARAATQRWHDRYQGFWPNAQLRVGIQNKSTVPASVYIDDAPHHIEQLNEAGKPVIIFDQPWNEDIELYLVQKYPFWRANDWVEVRQIIEEEM